MAPTTVAASRPKRSASSSPSKAAAAAASSPDKAAKRTKLNDGGAGTSSSTAEGKAPTTTQPSGSKSREDDDDLFDDDGLDSALLMEVAEAAERQAARRLDKADAANAEPSSAPVFTGSTVPSSRSTVHGAATNTGTKAESVKPRQVGAAPAHALTTPANLHSDDEVHTMEEEWRTKLQDELKKEYYLKLKAFIAAERKAGKVIYPPTHLVHNWSRLTPLRRVKVVVVGQDPYHGPGQACGHSFSVPKGVRIPASLQNIYKELKNEYPNFTPPKHGCLDEWAKQGVLLLNACLTVYGGQAGSHSGKGWETFTRVILKLIADEAARGGGTGTGKAVNVSAANPFGWATVGTSKTIAAAGGKVPTASPASSQDESSNSERCKGVVFLVWGQPAAKTVAAAGVTDKSPNVLILRSAHPSPLSAHRGFLGNGHFKKANDWLEKVYGPGGGIDWGRL